MRTAGSPAMGAGAGRGWCWAGLALGGAGIGRAAQSLKSSRGARALSAGLLLGPTRPSVFPAPSVSADAPGAQRWWPQTLPSKPRPSWVQTDLAEGARECPPDLPARSWRTAAGA